MMMLYDAFASLLSKSR